MGRFGWIVSVLAISSLILNAPALTRIVRSGCRMAMSWQDGFRSTGEQVDAARRMAAQAKANGRVVGDCCSCAKGLLPIERSRILAMSWVVLPDLVSFGPLRDMIGKDAIVVSEYDPVADKELGRAGYRAVERGGGVSLWYRGGEWADCSLEQEQGRIAEFASVAVFSLFLVVCFYIRGCEGCVLGITALSLMTFVSVGIFGVVSVGVMSALMFLVWGFLCLLNRGRAARWCCRAVDPLDQFGARSTVACLLAVVFISLALTHTFVAPNGLGTVGGKAKLMLLSEGFPVGFFTDPLYAPLQPAYPPGATSLVLWCYALSGICGEWLIQVVPCMIMVLLAGFVMSRIKSGIGVVIVATAFITPLALRMTTLFYPEVYVACCCLVGWERVRNDRFDQLGWVLIGAAGWFKNEGLIYFVALAAAFVVFTPLRLWWYLMLKIVVGAILPVAWHLLCRLAGASLEGYYCLGEISVAQGIEAFTYALRAMFCSAWQYAFAYPAAFLVLLAERWRNLSTKIAAVGVLIAVLLSIIVFSLSDAVDFEWHLESIERILWAPSLMLVRELLEVIAASLRERHLKQTRKRDLVIRRLLVEAPSLNG